VDDGNNTVTDEGGIMHQPKASALFT